MAAHATKYEWAAWGLMVVALVFTLEARLLPAMLAGLLVYELVALLAPKFVSGRLSHSRAKMVVVALISASVLAVLIGAVVGAVAYYKAEGGSYAALAWFMLAGGFVSLWLLMPVVRFADSGSSGARVTSGSAAPRGAAAKSEVR